MTEDIKLNEFEDEEIFDIVEQIETTFRIHFHREAFIKVNTFGDFCDVVVAAVEYEHRDGCTSQQAFYKIRHAIHHSTGREKTQILPHTSLATLFPLRKRRRLIRTFRDKLDIKMRLLTYPDWLGSVFFIGFLLSLIAFFFNWKIALSGIAFFSIAHWIAQGSGNILVMETVQELVQKITNEQYMAARRHSKTVNKHELHEIITNLFIQRLSIDKTQLTPDATFSWSN